MKGPGHVVDLLVSTDVGPWSSGAHPAYIVAINEQGATVVPLSSSKPRGHDAGFGYKIDNAAAVLSTPIWAYCHLPFTVSHTAMDAGKHRGFLKHHHGPIRDRMARYLGLPL